VVPPITGVILAGGESKRLGTEKALLPLLGRPLLSHVIEGIRPLVDDLLLVTGPTRRYEGFGVRVVTDAVDIRGSLAGGYSGLAASRHPSALVVACDMPFLSRGLLRHMIDLAPDWDVVIPRLQNGLEPLHAIYSRACLEPIRARLDRRDLRIIAFLQSVRVRYVGQDEIDRLDPDGYSFFNVNRRDDVAKMEAIAAERQSRQSESKGDTDG
jgi:molybdenum cofactor guanylyltransferase